MRTVQVLLPGCRPLPLTMLAALTTFWASWVPLVYTETPSVHELARGAQCYSQGKPEDRVWAENAQTIGIWSNGLKKVGVETCWWITPRSVARWLGYWATRERWTQEELQTRWESAKRRFDGRILMVVRLAAFPKQDLLEETLPESVKAVESNGLRALLTFGDGRTAERPTAREPIGIPLLPGTNDLVWNPKEQVKLALLDQFSVRAESSIPILNLDWWNRLLPVSTLRTTLNPGNLGSLLGPFQASFLVFEGAPPEELTKRGRFELRILGSGRERVARWTLFNGDRVNRR